jgi:exopolysaccharide production protein ExoQ
VGGWRLSRCRVADSILRLTPTRLCEWPAIAVFAALPSVGLVQGPSYAGLIFGLAVLQLAVVVVAQRRLPAIDRPLGLLAVAFVAWCWASVAWSIDPARSAAAALQMTAILAGCLIFFAGPRLRGGSVDRLFRVMLLATLLGGAIFLVDRALGYPLQSLFMGRSLAPLATKYNRGIDHLALIAWPQLAYFARRGDWRGGLLLVAGVAIIEGAGLSLAGQVGTVAGLTVLVVAYWRPRIVAPALAGATLLFAASLPLALRALALQRAAFAPYLKISGLHRLEIWDFMTARTLARPLLGWGFGIAGELPITPEELSHFVIQHDQGIYPHNQWLGLWVETGAPGAAIAAGFALLVLSRIRRLAPAIRPFGYATFACAMAISSVNFEVKTDSWWAALVASAYLLATLDTTELDTTGHAVLPAERA